ncbi:OmpA family protein [Acinetobacter larvae]|uniref:Flagellar motor protein MotB n=1 Tax=Acinetobacter larvae TaxID=1789224 RepID=A0A1B2M3I2_9GAMM|nr:OmpA family protein [Acinetobacter larvae]AOA59734.1 flagellar motor protein MotB [Acinetobacter larvae]
MLNKKLNFMMAISMMGLMACTKSNQTEQHTTTEASAVHAASATETTDAHTEQFDLAKLPVSDIALGEFPYISLPDGYAFHDQVTLNFEKTPFWTGQDITFVEGRLLSAQIRQQDNNTAGSFLALQRNLESVIQQLGGQRISHSKISAQALEKIPEQFKVNYVAGLGDIYNNPTETFVIRQKDKNIWYQLTQSGNHAGLLVAQTEALQITAKILSSNQLKTALDQDQKVNIQVNFETDKADIMPDSQAQIEQVIQLLEDNPELKLKIHGHTDHSGDQQHNQVLSEKRAQAIVQALTTGHNINPNRLLAKGFGDTQPLADNTTADGKFLNRRVELIKAN